MAEGVKHDQDKPRWDLLPWRDLEDVVKVLTFGVRKYSPDNWMKVPDSPNRYFSAAMRHIIARRNGERNDPETGFPHLAHAICCLLFSAWHDREGQSAK